MKRQSMGWAIVGLAILAAALAVAYAAPGGDAAKASATGCQMGACPGGDACPCKCGCADGKPCTCGKDCPCKCGCAEGKPCACSAGACPMMKGGAMVPAAAPFRINPESEKLWKQLGAAMALRHQKMWELFALQSAEKPDQKAIEAKLAQIAEIDRQMSVARGGLYQYRVEGKGAAMGGGCGMGGGMGHGKMMGMGGGGCGGGCAGAR